MAVRVKIKLSNVEIHQMHPLQTQGFHSPERMKFPDITVSPRLPRGTGSMFSKKVSKIERLRLAKNSFTHKNSLTFP